MAKKKRRRKRGFTIPLAPIAGLLAAPAVGGIVSGAMAGDIDRVVRNAGYFVGVDSGKFNASLLINNLTPVIVGLLVHKFVGGAPLNMNRMLAGANVPFIRI